MAQVAVPLGAREVALTRDVHVLAGTTRVVVVSGTKCAILGKEWLYDRGRHIGFRCQFANFQAVVPQDAVQ